MMKVNGLSDIQLILVYIFYNLIYSFTAYPMGILADRIGLWETLIIGLFLFALVMPTEVLTATRSSAWRTVHSLTVMRTCSLPQYWYW
jgi:fucose permease